VRPDRDTRPDFPGSNPAWFPLVSLIGVNSHLRQRAGRRPPDSIGSHSTFGQTYSTDSA
jgi:hypothetical protein